MSDFINTNDFTTFLQLDDLKGSFADDLAKIEAEREPDVDIDDEFPAEDEADYDFDLKKLSTSEGSLSFEDEDGWEESEESEEGEVEEDEVDESEVDEDDESEDAEEAAAEAEEDEDYEEGDAFDVDYETVITLPDGRDMTIEELANGYIVGTELAEREEQLGRHVSAFEERVAGLKDVLDLASLEADRVIQDYEGFDWETLAAQDPQAYVENSRFLEKYKQRRAELERAQERIRQEQSQKEQEAFQSKCIECVNVLKREIPNWDDNLYQNLMQYAIDLGATEDEVLKENRPSIFLALHKAYQFDKGKQSVMAKIKRPGAPRKVVKASGAKPRTSQNPNSAKVAKAFSEGRINHEQAFNFLED